MLPSNEGVITTVISMTERSDHSINILLNNLSVGAVIGVGIGVVVVTFFTCACAISIRKALKDRKRVIVRNISRRKAASFRYGHTWSGPPQPKFVPYLVGLNMSHSHHHHIPGQVKASAQQRTIVTQMKESTTHVSMEEPLLNETRSASQQMEQESNTAMSPETAVNHCSLHIRRSSTKRRKSYEQAVSVEDAVEVALPPSADASSQSPATKTGMNGGPEHTPPWSPLSVDRLLDISVYTVDHNNQLVAN